MQMQQAGIDGSQHCNELARLKCVFVVALGRTGSTHLLRLLNSIPGYRLSGETDNAWIYLGWWHAEQEQGKLSAVYASNAQQNFNKQKQLDQEEHFRSTQKVMRRLKSKVHRTGHKMPINESSTIGTLCAMRELMLMLHNPVPRARVFGFKEIYSPFVRNESAKSEVLEHGVRFLRVLFPDAKFVFHARRNLSRVVDSDFWHRDGSILSRTQRLQLMKRTVNIYHEYVAQNPQHAFATTLEGLVDRKDPSEVEQLFKFLGESLNSKLRRVARSNPPLRDWQEPKHTRRITLRHANGTVISVRKRSYAYKVGLERNA